MEWFTSIPVLCLNIRIRLRGYLHVFMASCVLEHVVLPAVVEHMRTCKLHVHVGAKPLNRNLNTNPTNPI
jgi:hypothetical protein